MMGGNGVTNIPGVSGGSGVSDGTGVAGVGGTQTLGLNFLSGALDPRISFTRATPATVTDFEGLIKTVKSGEVTFDGMRRVENLLAYSQDFSNAAWTKTNSSITSDSVIAPDGTLTADILIPNTSSAVHIIEPTQIISVGTTYTISFYAKAKGYSYLLINNSGSSLYAANFNLASGTVIVGSSAISASMTLVGNGWYRCQLSLTAGFTNLRLYVNTSTNLYGDTYTGDGYSGIYIWGAQIENVTGQTNQNPSE